MFSRLEKMIYEDVLVLKVNARKTNPFDPSTNRQK